jgi:hypothetical protein
VDDLASQGVLRHTGFSLIGRVPRYLRVAEEREDRLLFRRLADDRDAAAARV